MHDLMHGKSLLMWLNDGLVERLLRQALDGSGETCGQVQSRQDVPGAQAGQQTGQRSEQKAECQADSPAIAGACQQVNEQVDSQASERMGQPTTEQAGTQGELRKKGLTEKLVLNVATKEVMLGGKLIHFTPTEYRILACLMRNGRMVSSKEVLAAAAFPDEPMPSADVETHIKNIRRKIGDKADEPRFICVRRTFGYQMVAGSYFVLNETKPPMTLS